MANPTLLLSPRRSRDRSGAVEPTLSGGVIEVPGQYGRAWQVAEATENLVTDPRVTSTSQWLTHATAVKSLLTSGVDLDLGSTVITTAVRYTWGDVYSAGIDGPIVTVPAVEATRTAFLYVRASALQTVGKTFTLGMWNGGWLGTSVSISLTTDWQRVAISFPMTAAMTTAQFLPFLPSSAAGDIVDLTAVQFEDKAYATPYCDGTLGAGHAWTGAAHASTSTRTGAQVSMSAAAAQALYSATRGAVALRAHVPRYKNGTARSFRHNPASADAVGHMDQWGTGSTTTVLTSLTYSWWNGASAPASNVLSITGIPRGIEVSIYYEWDGPHMRMIVWSPTHGTLGDVANSTRVVSDLAINSIFYAGGSPSQSPNTEIHSVATFDAPLASATRDALIQSPIGWTWTGVGGDIPVDAIPSYRSSVYHIEPRVYLADRDNVNQSDITPWVSAISVDHDIDFAGPKSKVSLGLTDAAIAGAGDWIAPYVQITPEIGDIISAQRGLFQLDEPTITNTGIGPSTARGDGTDIVRLFERTVLQEPQETPKGCRIDSEVRFAIEASATGGWGSDLAPNGDFEAWDSATVPTSWSQASGGSPTATTFSTDKNWFVSGSTSYLVGVREDSPVDAYAYSFSTLIPIPAGARYILVQGFVAFASSMITASVMAMEVNAAGSTIVWHNPPRLSTDTTGGYDTWQRSWVIFTPHPDATHFRVRVNTWLRQQNTSGTGFKSARFDRVSAHVVQFPLLTRHAIPAFSAVSSTVIGEQAGVSWLERINNLLQAAAHHGVYALPDGRPTSRPQRDPRTDTPTRIFTIGEDARIVGDIVTTRAVTEFCNVVVAIKEDYETGTALIAIARNDDPTHRWSTVNYGEVAKRPALMVSDAVGQEELQALADAELAKSSMQEAVSLTVLPDPGLTVYDVIEITGTDGTERGRWAIEGMREGLTSAEPLLLIEARRILTSENPESA